MPIFFQQDIDEDTKLGIWKIEEEEEFFLEKVVPQRNVSHPHKKLQHLAGRYLLKYLFPEFPVELIQIADTRKPFLEDEAFHFSISHCSDYAAAIVSRTNRVGVDVEVISSKIERVGKKFVSEQERRIFRDQRVIGSPDIIRANTQKWVNEPNQTDIERTFQDKGSIKWKDDGQKTAIMGGKSQNGTESGVGGPDSSWLTLVWSCKEAVFKWYGWGGLDFKEHMQIIHLTALDHDQFDLVMVFNKNEELFLPLHSTLIGDLCLSYVVT